MSFVDSLDNLPAEDGAGRTKLFFSALERDWRGLFAELRQRRPVLDLPPFVVVSRWADVADILSRPGTFQVGYRPHMDPSVGPFMLARDNCEQNWRDKSVMRSLLRWSDVPGVRARAGQVAAERLAAGRRGNSIDIAQAVSRTVPLQIVRSYFGFPGPDEPTMLAWSRATQADMFYNLAGDPAVLAANVEAGTAMRAWLRDHLEQRRPWSAITEDDVCARLLRMSAAGLSGLDTEAIVSNLCGLLVGAVETTSQAIVNATEQILLRPDIAARAIAAARESDTAPLDAIVWEALRFNPETSFVVRVAAEAAVLAPGSEHEIAIRPGRAIAAAIGSAMFDPSLFPEPDAFRERPRDAYLHMGLGLHECLGRFVAGAIVPETIRQILLMPGIGLLPDGGSRIDHGGGPFPERCVLACDGAEAHA
ncbi:cytochrome P450 [Methylobacterium nigriterrae]|uniref:cytochrome P450 n=1 Tax=Methylobacterium nigriterrae TaxID=3127512 RepID=UPI003013E77F